MTREFAAPTSTEGFKVTVISDTHFGRRSWTNDAMANAARSFDAMSSITDLFVHGGDVIHWNTAGAMASQDSSAKAWINARKTNTGKPWKLIAGNHDLCSYGTPFPSRTGDQWATDYGESKMSFIDHSDWLRILFVTPNEQLYNTTDGGYMPMALGNDQVTWIVDRAGEVPNRQVYVVFHAPLPSQFPSHMDGSNLMTQLEQATNIIGWVSGHRHTNVETDNLAFLNFKVQTRLIHHINVPTFGGATGGYTDDRWGQPFVSTHLTIHKDKSVEIRFRDHMQNRWLRAFRTGMYVTTLPPV